MIRSATSTAFGASLLTLLVGLALTGALTLLPLAPAAAQVVVWIDAGHGGSDGGAQGCGLSEADLNLDVALRLEALMAADAQLEPLMSRTTDVFVTLGNRAAFANDAGAARFVSIHTNSFTSSAANGTETYAATNGSSTSLNQRGYIQDAMVNAWGLTDRGEKTAGFSVLVNTQMPATLSEMGFITSCTVDVPFLGSPSERQIMAAAHHAAMRASLGLTGTIPDPPASTGTLRGVAFQDQGVGTADMSVRLPGAKLTVSGPAATQTATADGSSAEWDFTVAPGSWKVTATYANHDTATRNCTVTKGATTWCSIGLFEKAAVVPDPDPPAPDVPEPKPDLPPTPDPTPDTAPTKDTVVTPDPGPQPDAQPDAPADTGVPRFDANPLPDGQPSFDPGGPSQVSASVPFPATTSSRASIVDQSGCGAAPDPASGAAWLLALLLMAAAFRPRRAWLALLALLALAACQAPERSTPAATVPVTTRSAALEATAALTLAEAAPLTPQAGYTRPVWSPDGQHLAVAGPGLDRVYLLAATGGEPRELAQGQGVGRACQFSPDGQHLELRHLGQRTSDVPVRSVTLDGQAGPPPAHRTPGVWVLLRDEQVWLREGTSQRRLSPDGDRFCCARTSSDGDQVLFQGLTTGLWLADTQTHQLTQLGQGESASLSPDGSTVAFVRSVEDGEQVIARTLHLATIEGGQATVRPIEGAPKLADHPSLSPDGAQLAFDADGAIWSARIQPKN